MREPKMLRTTISDKFWKRLQVLILDVGGHITGFTRRHLEGIIWRARVGSPWRDIPDEFGKWNSIYRLFKRWCEKGIWESLCELIEGKLDLRSVFIDSTYIRRHQHASGAPPKKKTSIGKSRGGPTTKIHVAVDRKGDLVKIGLSAGNIDDACFAEDFVGDIEAEEIVADRAYDSEYFRYECRSNGLKPIIPRRRTSKKPNPEFSRWKYRKRHLVENYIEKLKRYRGISSRYEKLHQSFNGLVILAAILIWAYKLRYV